MHTLLYCMMPEAGLRGLQRAGSNNEDKHDTNDNDSHTNNTKQ